MQCSNCHQFERLNTWTCPNCNSAMSGGIVFVTGITGSQVGQYLERVVAEARKHQHEVRLHDIGEDMHNYAREDQPDVKWDRILDADEKLRGQLRLRAFDNLASDMNANREALHLVDLHLCFRWKAYLTKGLGAYHLKYFEPFVRCFVNIVEDISKVQDRLRKTSWRKRKVLELLLWRDEELFLTDVFADVCHRVKSYALAAAEPPSQLEQLIWHPERKKVYLSFPMRSIERDRRAQAEIKSFRDQVREFLVVFDPDASKDYTEAGRRREMRAVREKVGDTTEERDYRFIDQADAVVVYFPRKVPSKGVDAEMNYASRTGKPIYLYCPEDVGSGPFVVPPARSSRNGEDFVRLLRSELG